MRPAPLLALCCLIAAPATGEGARLTFACRVQVACTGDGECTPRQDPVRYIITPKALDADGIGAVLIEVGDEARPGHAAGRHGPFFWTASSGETAVLTPVGDTAASFASFDAAASPTLRIFNLTCEVTQ